MYIVTGVTLLDIVVRTTSNECYSYAMTFIIQVWANIYNWLLLEGSRSPLPPQRANIHCLPSSQVRQANKVVAMEHSVIYTVARARAMEHSVIYIPLLGPEEWVKLFQREQCA